MRNCILILILLATGCRSILFQDLHRESRIFSVSLKDSDTAWSRMQFYLYTVMGYTTSVQSDSGTIRVTDTSYSTNYNELAIVRVVKNDKPIITILWKKMVYGDDQDVKDQIRKMKNRLAEIEEYARTGTLSSVPKN